MEVFGYIRSVVFILRFGKRQIFYSSFNDKKTLYWYLFIKKNDKVTILAEIAIFSIFLIEGKYNNFQIWMHNYFAQLKIINLQST